MNRRLFSPCYNNLGRDFQVLTPRFPIVYLYVNIVYLYVKIVYLYMKIVYLYVKIVYLYVKIVIEI